jgi:uncharacterized protein YsxB (DUF464 family)
MIKARLSSAAFTVENHGASHVCAAVSMLVINTVNAIEAFTSDSFTCEHNPQGGYLAFSLDNPAHVSEGTRTLLDALRLGLTTAASEHPTEIKIESE